MAESRLAMHQLLALGGVLDQGAMQHVTSTAPTPGAATGLQKHTPYVCVANGGYHLKFSTDAANNAASAADFYLPANTPLTLYTGASTELSAVADSGPAELWLTPLIQDALPTQEPTVGQFN